MCRSGRWRCRRFNTQPPEGGWLLIKRYRYSWFGFNTQPPEGGWVRLTGLVLLVLEFQHTAA